MKSLLCLLLASICLTSANADTPAAPNATTTLGAPGSQTAQVFHLAGSEEASSTIHYWLHLPAGAKPGTTEKFPLLLFLHGSGERGSDLEKVKNHGPPKLIGKNAEMDQCIIISPQCPDKQWWDTKLLRSLCDELGTKLPVDPNRRYLTGLSMGGFGTWSLLEENPTYWAAAVPICGGGHPEAAAKFKDVPIWIFHGAKDPAVPVKASEDMFAALEAAGGHPKKTIYPEEKHQSWIPAYNDAALWKWLLAQKLSAGH